MVKTRKNIKFWQRHSRFFFACLCSLIGLTFYLLGKYVVPFPDQWFVSDQTFGTKKLFFLGIGIHMTVSWILGFFFTFTEFGKFNREKLQKWKFWITKILVIIASMIVGLLRYDNPMSNETIFSKNLLNICLLALTFAIVSCIIDLIVQFMNRYGICNGFNLLLFSEFLPVTWFRTLWQEEQWTLILLLFLLTTLFVWFTSLKWEVPVESNSLHFADNPVIKKSPSKFGIKMNFSFMPFFQLNSLLSFFFIFRTMIKNNTRWTNYKSLSINNQVAQTNWMEIKNSPPSNNSFGKAFLSLNEKPGVFAEAISWFKEKKWIILGALLFLILVRYLISWIFIRKSQLKTKEIAKSFRQQGIYINNIPPNRYTRQLLKRAINKLIFYWNMMVLIFNIIFDQIFNKNYVGSFFNWFGSVNIAVGLIQQIQTKFKYIQINN